MNTHKIITLLSIIILILTGCTKENNQINMEKRESKGLSTKVNSVLYTLKNAKQYKIKNYDKQKIVIVAPEISVENAKKAENKIHDIFSEEYGINKKIVFVGLDDTNCYQDELLKYIEKGNQIDIVCTGYNNVGYGALNHSCDTYQEFVNNNWLVDITKYINSTENQKLKSLYNDEQLKSLMIDEKIYGITGNRMFSSKVDFSFNKKLCENNNIDLSDFNGSFKWIKEKCNILKSNNVKCDYLFGGLNGIDDIATLSGLLNEHTLLTYGIGIYKTDTGFKAVNIYEDTNIRTVVSELSELYSLGYIFDSDEQESTGEFFIKNLNEYDLINPEEPDNIVNKNVIPSYYSNINNFVCGVCTLSENKNLAFKVLAELYSNESLSNLLKYGKDDLSKISEEDFQSNYAYLSLGNDTLTFPNKYIGEPENKLENIDKLKKNAIKNPLLGFRVDLSKFDFNQLYEINSQGENIFMGFCADNWKDSMNEISNQLKSANIDEVLTDINRQLDEFYNGKSKSK